MTSLAIALLLLIRLVIPVALLLTIGEWIRCREIKYWFQI